MTTTTPGPLKVLVAVGSVPDRERELETIVNSLESARRLGNAYVRVLEVGSPEQIGAALGEHGYHVLHLAACTKNGALELEDEDGNPVEVSARELADNIHESGQPAPLVFLVCAEAAPFAQALVESGVPAVLAMETGAVELTSKFYEELARAEQPLVSRALALARTHVEGSSIANLFLSGDEQPLLDRGLPQVSIHESRSPASGVVPRLKIGDLIGRRSEMREILQALTHGQQAGCQILGSGGIGKTALAGRIIERMSGRGWRIAIVSGAWDLGRLANAMGSALWDRPKKELIELARSVSDPQASDRDRLQRLQGLLQNHEVVLVLDHFEDAIDAATGEFRDIITAEIFAMLVRSATRGKLLITSRYPVPHTGEHLYRADLGPLSDSEVRRLILRLRGLRQQSREALKLIERAIDGHPRTVEYLDGLIRHGNVRIDSLHERLKEKATPTAAAEVLIDELVRVVGRNRDDLDVLWRASVFPFPVLASALAADAQRSDIAERIERLAASSLLTPIEHNQVFVQRWTAELLKPHMSADEYRTSCSRGAEYLKNRGAGEGRDWVTDWSESIRLLLAAQEFDAAVGVTQELLQVLQPRGQTTLATQLAREVARALPEGHADKLRFMIIEGDGLAWLGLRAEALERYSSALEIAERLVAQEPGRADTLRDLLVVYNRNGDLQSALGDREKAREFYEKALQIAEQMVGQEPGRADYLRDLSVSYNKLGDFERSSGEESEAQQFYERALEVRERLVEQVPARVDYRLDLARSLARFSDAERLERAWEILTGLRESGQLAPDDLPVLQFVEDRLRRTKTAGMS